jgi:hypothetical protein
MVTFIGSSCDFRVFALVFFLFLVSKNDRGTENKLQKKIRCHERSEELKIDWICGNREKSDNNIIF